MAMECENCGEERNLMAIAGEEEGFDDNVGWCEECIREDDRLELVPYDEEREGELRRLMKHPADWYKEVKIKDESILEELRE